ncbi:hypothetical protein G7085_02305 [Tessaracoccus sp. HDW20]|nr:hypothetical protein [Tessaracoccus coleopterorum]NHB83899.1 hypothetical protein [Tessaracoccus coleopterorum]
MVNGYLTLIASDPEETAGLLTIRRRTCWMRGRTRATHSSGSRSPPSP